MKPTVSDQLLDRLHQWGVRRIYGYPGDGINGLMAAFVQAIEQVDGAGAGRCHLDAHLAGARW